MADPRSTGAPVADSLLSVPPGPCVVPKSDASAGEVPRVSVVIPTYQESESIEAVVAQVSAALDRVTQGSFEVIVVDDDSPDGTWHVALGTVEHFPRVRVMRRTGDRGLSTAVVRGWQVARGEILGVIDGDLQHPPEVLALLYKKIGEGFDLVVGSRHVAGGGVSDWRLTRRLLSRGAQALGLLLLPRVLTRVSDPMSGCFMVRREAIENVPFSPVGYKILIEVIGRGRVGSIGEIGYVFRERSDGHSKVTLKVYVDYVRHLARLRVAALRQSRS